MHYTQGRRNEFCLGGSETFRADLGPENLFLEADSGPELRKLRPEISGCRILGKGSDQPPLIIRNQISKIPRLDLSTYYVCCVLYKMYVRIDFHIRCFEKLDEMY